MRQTVSLFFVAMCVAVPVAAQQAIREIPAVPAIPAMVEQQAPPLPPPPARVPAPTPPPAPPSAPRIPAPTPQAAEAPSAPRQVDPRIDQSDVNIKLTVKITDASASGTQTKVVSLIMANRGNGRVRSSGVTSGSPERTSDLNVDARATLYKSGAINTNLTISYTPERTDEPSKLTSVSQSVELFLKEGVATLITQAADPTKGSRSVSIEVTASVMK